MILIQSASADASTSDVLDWLFYYGEDKIRRLNNEFSVQSVTVNNDAIMLSDENSDIDLSGVSAYWYRRGTFAVAIDKTIIVNPFVESLSKHFYKEMDTIYSNIPISYPRISIGKFTDNSIDKLRMLIIARTSGLKIPKTIITGDTQKLNDFIGSCEGPVITKAIDNDRYVFFKDSNFECSLTLSTKIINPDIFLQAGTSALPALFQEYIEKKYEIRVFYLTGKFFAMAIFSQMNEKTKIDFRNYDTDFPNRIVPYKLPEELQIKLNLFMQSMLLDTGSIDLIYTVKGEYVFLEVNPVGQYQWMEKHCNYSISKEIAQELMNYGQRKN